MGKVKQILQLLEQGVSQREISRRLNVNRKTIVHYLSKMEGLKHSKQELLTMPDIELELLFLHKPELAETKEEYQYLESLFPYFKKELH
jgi:orotate phosphoribosyltransferase-like protein